MLVKSRATGVVSRHKFRALPSGSFDDQFAEVMLTIKAGSVTGDTRIAMPVASAPGLEPRPLVEITRVRTTPEALSLGGLTQVRLTVKNVTKGVPLLITSAVVVRPDTPGLWNGLAATFGSAAPIPLAADASETLTVDIQPQTWSAIEASLVPTEADKPHTAFHLDVPYANPIFGNRPGNAAFTVPLRFRPSILSLLTSLLTGVALGSLIPLLASKRGTMRTWGRATVTALIVAIILELVGIFLVANNSKFVLFGFNLDPWQTCRSCCSASPTACSDSRRRKKLKFIQDKKTGQRIMRRWRFPSSIIAAVVAMALVSLSWGDSFVVLVEARQTASTRMATYGAGPVALGVQQGDEAVVLQADGQAYSLNMTTGVIGPRVYRVPAGFQAVDVVAGRVRGTVVTCFSVNPRSSKDGRSFVLQVTPDKGEVWSWLRVPGVYVGLAIEPARGVAYAANSTTNEIYAVTIGNQNVAPTRVVAIPGAVRLGALAIAPAARRLYVADMGAARIYTIELAPARHAPSTSASRKSARCRGMDRASDCSSPTAGTKPSWWSILTRARRASKGSSPTSASETQPA